MHDEVIYRCIHAGCAHQLPRKVNFCPYCGTGQHAGVDKPTHALPKAAPVQDNPSPAPAPVKPAAPPVTAAPKVAPQVAATPAVKPRVVSGPPQREPVKTRYWILTLLLLWGIWITTKPASQKIDERIDRAIAMSRECKSGEAQAELIALRSSKATPEQLQRLQQAINAEAVSCARPPKTARRDNSSARNLVADAQRALARNDYRGAIDKMEVCIAMVEGGSRECGAVKLRAERLLCTETGGDWEQDRCQ